MNERRADSSFLPNFCDPRMVLAVVLISELLALTFALIRRESAEFLTGLARLSLLMQWLGLTSAAWLCAFRRRLPQASVAGTTMGVLSIILANILLLSAVIVWFGRWFDNGETLAWFPERVWPFAARNLAIGLIVTGLLLRYFFVAHEWRRHVESEARSRIDALQARIRPHFLFNSLNTIAALTRSDPRRAEAAVEDLADLFRASLGEAGRLQPLAREIELARLYERIENQRLGDRLRVVWQIAELPMNAQLPILTLQPLLENAILHGIEPLEGGGQVTISGRVDADTVEIVVGNPLAASTPAAFGMSRQPALDSPVGEPASRHGQGMATDNIRERLQLAFAGEAKLDVSRSEAYYEVRLRFPCRE